MRDVGRLLISCPDRPGLVAAVSSFLFERGANILASDQHATAPEGGTFFLRTEFRLGGLDAAAGAFAEAFRGEVAEPRGMDWRLARDSRPQRIAIMASREEHCLLDLLWRWRRGDLGGEVVCVVSNHPDLAGDAEAFGLPYHHIPVTPETKSAAEAEILERLRGACDVVVLARWMQILSRDFLEAVGVPVINIHHSFLPAFAGADPYRRALERGVKIIGATAHYVTEELDAGPIIEQDVVRTSHRATVDDLVRMGADIERTVLARAVQWHLQDRVLVHGNKTAVFA